MNGVSVLVVDPKINDTVSILAHIIVIIMIQGSTCFAKLAVRLGDAASVATMSQNVLAGQMDICVMLATKERIRGLLG